MLAVFVFLFNFFRFGILRISPYGIPEVEVNRCVVWAVPNVSVPMSHIQSWALSQEANKSNGVCSVCRATRQLHLKDGTVHKHGPRDKPCSGSHKPPLGAACQRSASNDHSTHSAADTAPNSPVCTASSIGIGATTVSSQAASSQPMWSPVHCHVIKHIPKSARPSCASHLAGILRAIVARPDECFNWF